MAIPKLIHQTYKNHDLPADIQSIVDELKANNSDWEYRFYSDDDILAYIKTHFDERTLDAYLRINPVFGAAKADLFRYLVLYNEGGVYLDIKSTCIYPLSQVIQSDDTFIVTQWQNDKGQTDEGTGLFTFLTQDLNIAHGEYQQWFIICERHSPIMKYVVDRVIDNILGYRAWHYGFYSYGKRGVLSITGPIAYTKAVHEIQNNHPIRFVRYDKDIGFVYNALKNNQSHTKVLSQHYTNYKGYVVNQGMLPNLLSSIYIFGTRLLKNSLKIIGQFKE